MDPNQNPTQPPQPVNPINPTPPTQPPVQPVVMQSTFAENPSHPLSLRLVLGLVGAFIIVLGLFIGGSYFFGTKQYTADVTTQVTPIQRIPTATPTPINPTANWQIYTNTTFTIKYPPSYTFEKTTNGVKFQDKEGNTVFIATANNTKNLTLDSALGNGPSLSYTNTALIGKTPLKIKFDDTEAMYVEDLSVGQAGIAVDLIAIRNNKLYQIYSPTVSYKNLRDMISTFKFTEPTATIPPGRG